MPQKRRRRRHRLREPLQQGVSRRRLGEDAASLPGSLADSDSSSHVDVDGGSPPPGLPDEPVRYHQFIASRLARLQLPDDDQEDMAGGSSLPSAEILEALTRKSFHDDDSRAALVEYMYRNFLNDTLGPDIRGIDTDSGESEPDDLIIDEKYTRGQQVVGDRMTEIDTYTELDQEQTNKLHLKHAIYRIKAALLLKGRPADELDAAALEHKYPPELIVANEYFFRFVNDGYFSWYFDSDLCSKEYLSDYQRLVLVNDGYEYRRWSSYRALYSTPEADRVYLRYWETLVEKMKWLKKYMLIYVSSREWAEKDSKAGIQAVRIAAEFPHMTMELAAIGFSEYIWKTRTHLLFSKDLDGMFYEVWRQVNVYNQGFRDAVKHVYGEKLFPAQDCNMKYVMECGGSSIDLLFRRCTGGLSKDIPEYRARELIAQEIHWRGGLSGSYEQYARKKLKIAEVLGLIPKEDKLVAA